MSEPPQEPSYPWGPPDPTRPQPSASAGGDQPSGEQASEAGSAPSTGSHAAGGPYAASADHGQGQGAPQYGSQQQYPAQPAQQYGSAPYGQGYGQAQGYGQPAQYGYSGTPYGQEQRTATPVSTIVLLVVSGLCFLSGVFSLAAIAPLVLAIIALVKHQHDTPLARRLTRIGWIVFAVLVVLSILAIIVLIVVLVHDSNSSDGFQTSFAVAHRLGEAAALRTGWYSS